MLALLFAVAVVVAVVALVSVAYGRRHRFDDVARFHRARQMTTEWARAGVSQPLIGPQPTATDERETAER